MLRFPEGMRSHVAEAAAKSGRSMNAEIIARLHQTFQWDAAEHPHPGELAAEILAATTHLQRLVSEFSKLQIDRSLPDSY